MCGGMHSFAQSLPVYEEIKGKLCCSMADIDVYFAYA